MPDQALETAQSLGLAALAAHAGTDPADRADWDWARIGIEARLHPVSMPTNRLEPLVGAYGRNRIVLRDGALWFGRADRPSARLTAMTQDGLFGVGGFGDALRLRLTGPVMEMSWIDEPAPSRIPRSSTE